MGEPEFGEFEVLSHPVRVGILEVLAEQLKAEQEAPTLGFSELRRAVGMRDSGNFNYHLDRVRDRFVRKTEDEDGYRITAAGLQVVAAVISGTYGSDNVLGPEPIGDPCPVCGDELRAVYDSGLLTVSCPADHEFRHPLPQGAVAERDIDGVVRLLTLTVSQDLFLASEGVCPICSAALSWTVEPPFDEEFPHVGTQCSRCGARLELPVVVPLVAEPAGIRFFHERGVDVRRRSPWDSVFYDGVTVSPSLPVEVCVELAGDRLTATIAEDLTVQAIERHSGPCG